MTINISISILPDGAIPVDVMGGENNNCPLATQDEELNAENRQIAVEEADYREALRAEYVCGNCSAYNQTDEIKKCIGLIQATLDIVRFGSLCARARTCVIIGQKVGPITSEKQPSYKDNM